MDSRRTLTVIVALAVLAGALWFAFSMGWGAEILGKVIPIALVLIAVAIFQSVRKKQAK
jgi:hypothetical protein